MSGPEDDLQAQVVDVVELFGWEWRHVSATAPTADGSWRPDYGARDLPDLICWTTQGRPGVIGLELKTGARKLTDGQHELLVAWRAAGVPCWVIREAAVPEIPRLLRQAQDHCAGHGFLPEVVPGG